jgi:hypothetical protein
LRREITQKGAFESRARDFRLDAVARRRTMLPIAFPKIAKCSGHRAIKFRIAIAPT